MFTSNPITNWRLYAQRYQLQGTRCTSCNKIFYPKKYICSCGSFNFEPYKLSGKGILETFTKVAQPATEFDSQGYFCLGLIKLNEGPRILAQIADVEITDLFIGQTMEGVLRKYFTTNVEDIIHYGLKFIPTQKKS